ncbi:transposase [Methylorubrum thiocyanatum]|uniref:Transposase n=1 Tax=Methylorubrum thiocyanatum TaxID=47958 RepID=A0AA40VCG4_9HYPH|nr:transposase [Methylorubrum thiocyanatum]
MVLLGELLMILDLHRQGLSVTAIARRTGRDPKTVRKYIERGLEPPAYGPRQAGRPSKLAPYLDYLRERVAAFPDLSAVRLTRELRERGYTGAYTAVKRFVAAIRPAEAKPYEVRFETPAGQQAQVDFARFVVTFTDAPDTACIVWLFSLVLGHSRHIEARFVLHQDLQTLLRCHMQAFTAIGGVPIEILYDRMKTAVTGEDTGGHIVYNRSLLALAIRGLVPAQYLPALRCPGSASNGRTGPRTPCRPPGAARSNRQLGPCHPFASLEHALPVDRREHAFLEEPRGPAWLRAVDEPGREAREEFAAVTELGKQDLAALDRQRA